MEGAAAATRSDGRGRLRVSLAVEGIVKRYGEATVLDGVSLAAPAGAVTGLIGPNGSGKSTLFDVITALVPLDEGVVTVEGTAIGNATPAAVAQMGLVRTFQVPRVARGMTVVENLMLAPPRGEGESLVRLFSPFHVRRVRRDELERRRRAWAMLDLLGLDHMGLDFAGVLSGGQLKLLSIGMALMMEPRTLLLDEPTAGVNPVLIQRILEAISARRESGATTLVIEHNISVVSQICDTAYVLDAGSIIAHGTPAEVRSDERVISAYLGKRERGAV
jgi:ABC-type branched-subunit amino acid transport system ATPase component